MFSKMCLKRAVNERSRLEKESVKANKPFAKNTLNNLLCSRHIPGIDRSQYSEFSRQLIWVSF